MANHLRREPFDRDRNFVATKGFILHGKDFDPGDPFNKTLVNTRRLRQMYDSRLIRMEEVQQSSAPTVTFNVNAMTDNQLSLFLEDNGVIPRFGASRDWLLRKVKELKNAGTVVGKVAAPGDGAKPPVPAGRVRVERVRVERA